MNSPITLPATTSTTFDLIGAPAEYQLPLTRPTLAEAKAWCKQLTATHYENFHVAGLFLPKRLRPHFESVYAYCRVSDDLGDEVADSATATRLLATWGRMLDECYDSPAASRHPVFVALHETIAACDLPRQLFHDLLRAFTADQTKTHFASLAELEAYSTDSANPVGRLVLAVCGYRDESLNLLSDKICTALQLANFWQDIVEDWERGRRYLPADLMARFAVADADISARRSTPQLRLLMKHLVELTRKMLTDGGTISQRLLTEHNDRELANTLSLFRKGGEAILDAIAAQDFDTLTHRPEVTKIKKLSLLSSALIARLLLFGGAR